MFHVVESWDWSGRGTAAEKSPGIARAVWESESGEYSLTHRFTRNEVLAILKNRVIDANSGRSALVAFDFPFSFPFAEKGNQFMDNSTNWHEFCASVFRLMRPNGEAKNVYGSPADYGQNGFPDHFSHRWKGADEQGRQREGLHYVEAYRLTERKAREIKCPAASVFKLVKPMVGVQALAGIYMLYMLLDWCRENKFPLTIWPIGCLSRDGNWHEGKLFKSYANSVMILESYPRVSFCRAGVRGKQIRNWGCIGETERAAEALGVVRGTLRNYVKPSVEHERDALIALLHLLSPGWFFRQIRPAADPVTIHLNDVVGELLLPANLQTPGVALGIRVKEGHIFGL
jgi:hypothetical protein